MIKGSINKIETLGLVDGPGIRTIIFLNGCKLRCSYCHNPEMFKEQQDNYSKEQLVNKIKRYKTYYKNKGGVTFSGGEPLLQSKFLIAICKDLKKEGINIALDTAGVGVNEKLTEEVLKYVDLVLFDIKHYEKEAYNKLTGHKIEDSLKFIELLNKQKKRVWIRQVIIPNYNDNEEYLIKLKKFISNINNVERIDFLPFHNLAIGKYDELNLSYKMRDVPAMDDKTCQNLYQKYLNL